jgi:ribosome modulation factor
MIKINAMTRLMATRKKKPKPKERDEGYAAGYEGKPKNSCPYEKGSKERREWLSGWAGGEQDLTSD